MSALFCSSEAQLLPRWLQAFEHAEIADFNSLGERLRDASESVVIWLDLASREMPASEQLARLKALIPKEQFVPIVALSSTPDSNEGLRLINEGAMGYAHRYAHANQLRSIESLVLEGGIWLGPELLQRVLEVSCKLVGAVNGESQTNGRGGLNHPAFSELTPTERRVAEIVARGASNKEVARVLDVTERTIKAHLTAIFKKTHVRDRVHLALLFNG